MQRRAGSGGELDVFGATRYFEGFAGLAAGPVANVWEAEDVMIQVIATHDMNYMEESYHTIQELGLGSKSKRNLATFFGPLVSPAGSFRMNPPASGSTTTTTSGSHDEPPQRVSSSSSRGSSDTATAAAAVLIRDLGEVVGDRRLQGVRVVRGASGEEERWVVRCGGRVLDEEEHHVRQEIVHTASIGDHQAVQGVEDGDDSGSDSDTSSDLFELDLEDANNH
uniref:Uncharacterized protein n=1 Tax=Avena sativa TaxID=4498 RepID=A0ACD5WPI7_AVESA